MGGNRSQGVVPDAVEYLLGSRRRVEVLAALATGPRRQATVARELGVGRSTVHRCVEAFADRGWVKEVESGYALTVAGERVLSAYRTFARTVEGVSEHEPLLRCFEDVDAPVPVDALADATVVTATPQDPHAAVAACADLLRGAGTDRVRTAWSGVSPITNSAGEAHLRAGNEVEMVVDRETLLAARASYFENYQLALASDGVDLLVTENPIRAGVLLTGDRVAVIGYEGGRTSVCVHGRGDELRAWAAELYEHARSRAAAVEVRYPPPPATPADRPAPGSGSTADPDSRDSRRR